MWRDLLSFDPHEEWEYLDKMAAAYISGQDGIAGITSSKTLAEMAYLVARACCEERMRLRCLQYDGTKDL